MITPAPHPMPKVVKDVILKPARAVKVSVQPQIQLIHYGNGQTVRVVSEDNKVVTVDLHGPEPKVDVHVAAHVAPVVHSDVEVRSDATLDN